MIALPVPHFAHGLGASQAIVSSLASAINAEEGAAAPNNNPGNLMDVSYYQQTGLYRPMVYPTLADGQAAENALIGSYVDQGLTLQQFFQKWAPAGQGNNNPTAYASFVSSQTGLPSDVPLNAVPDAGSLPSLDLSSLGLPSFSLPDLSQSTIFPGVPDWVTWLGAAGIVVIAIARGS